MKYELFPDLLTHIVSKQHENHSFSILPIKLKEAEVLDGKSGNNMYKKFCEFLLLPLLINVFWHHIFTEAQVPNVCLNTQCISMPILLKYNFINSEVRGILTKWKITQKYV